MGSIDLRAQGVSVPAGYGAAGSRGVSFVRGADKAKCKLHSTRPFVPGLEVVEVLQVVGSVSEANERKPEYRHSYVRSCESVLLREHGKRVSAPTMSRATKAFLKCLRLGRSKTQTTV
jgi:hypothetical protein